MRDIYSVDADAAWAILDNVVTLGIDVVVLAMSRRGFFSRLVRGDTTTALAEHLPAETSLLVMA